MYLSTGQTKMYPYKSKVYEAPILTLDKSIKIVVDNMHVVQHLYPLFLVEAAILFEGQIDTWNFCLVLVYTAEIGKWYRVMWFQPKEKEQTHPMA